jgi:hypothetical protein
MKRLASILVLALGLRLFAAFACDVKPDYSDMLEYNQMAIGVAVNPQHGYGYASFLWLIYSVFGKLNYLAVFVVQAVIGTMSVALIYYVAWKVSTRRAALPALIAALIASIYPYFIAYTITCLTETLSLFLFLCVLALILTPVQDKVKSCALAKLLAWSVWIKPVSMFFAPAILLLIKKRAVFMLLAVPLCFLAIWQFGDTPSGATAYNFYAVHNQNSTGRYLAPAQLPLDYTKYTNLELVKLGIQNTMENPRDALKVVYNKIVLLFAPGYDHHAIDPMIGSNKPLHWMLDLFYPVLAIFAFIGMARYPDRRLLLPLFSYLAFTILLFAFEYRYRLMIEPIVIIYAAKTLDWRKDTCAA